MLDNIFFKNVSSWPYCEHFSFLDLKVFKRFNEDILSFNTSDWQWPSSKGGWVNKCPALHRVYKIARYSAVWCSTVQCSAVQFGVVQCSAVWCSSVQCSSIRWDECSMRHLFLYLALGHLITWTYHGRIYTIAMDTL